MSEERSYADRLNISTLSISEIKNLIKTNIINTIKQWTHQSANGNRHCIKKQTFHIIGPAGIGKTEICFQLVEELSRELNIKFNTRKITCPYYSKDDFLSPFPVVDKENLENTRIFKMLLSEFVPSPEEEYGIFIIDEFSRGEKQLQQLLWPTLNEQQMHTYVFPKGWWVVATDNPDEQIYEMETMEDPAGIRRMLHLYTEVSASDFINYGKLNNFHPMIIEFIQTYPNYLYDFESQKVGAVYANPASYEKLSDILWGFEINGGVLNNLDQIEVLASGLLNISMTRLFISFIQELNIISPKIIFNQYDKVRKDIINLVEKGGNSKLYEIMEAFMTYLKDNLPKYGNNEINNIANFITDLPVDIGVLFLSEIYNMRVDVKKEEFKYFTYLHKDICQFSEKYKRNFVDVLTNLQKRNKET